MTLYQVTISQPCTTAPLWIISLAHMYSVILCTPIAVYCMHSINHVKCDSPKRISIAVLAHICHAEYAYYIIAVRMIGILIHVVITTMILGKLLHWL